MLSVSDLRISISSVEFSLFFQNDCTICPNCGHLLDSNVFSEVKLSSLVLLLGFGSLICYKLMSNKKKKKKLKYLPFGFAKVGAEEDFENINIFDENIDLSNNLNDTKIQYKMITSTPFVNWSQTPSLSSGASELAFNLTDNGLDYDSSSFQTPSFKPIGNNTVAKLDQLLNQIEDIKRSVYEIDEQIFDVKDSNVKFESKLFNLGPDYSLGMSSDSDLIDKFNFTTTEPQTPTLEWDVTDLNGLSTVNMNANYDQINESNQLILNTKSHLHPNTIAINNLNDLNPLESPQDLSSTSGEFSLSSPSDDTKDSNLAAIQRMISDAKKLGLLDDLIDIIIKNSKRDSAYYED
ncbi:uncharacterized protein LOC128959940 [Oppia nitens]|uniref:uncharacterized protein LOC128959940 n=1 Tax=Oppia nitens TaxID=1686743 RepID=UPI0023D9E5A6|nr:uncharacterized protein LOC128959940 [Oppia nitens]